MNLWGSNRLSFRTQAVSLLAEAHTKGRAFMRRKTHFCTGYPPRFSIFAHVSRRPIVRLNTNLFAEPPEFSSTQ